LLDRGLSKLIVDGLRWPWLRPGDRARLDVERLGSLDSTVDPAQPLQSP
jgi:hypothetical protein